MKTNAARILDGLGIAYELVEYDVDPENLDGETVAKKIGLSPDQVWKTLVARGDRNGVCFAVVPVNAQLSRTGIPLGTASREHLASLRSARRPRRWLVSAATGASTWCRSKRYSRSPATSAAA